MVLLAVEGQVAQSLTEPVGRAEVTCGHGARSTPSGRRRRTPARSRRSPGGAPAARSAGRRTPQRAGRSPPAVWIEVSMSRAALSPSRSPADLASSRARSTSSRVAGSRSSASNASAVRSRPSPAGSPATSGRARSIRRVTSPAGGRTEMMPGPAPDQLGGSGEVHAGARAVARPQRSLGGQRAQPQGLVAELAALGRAGRQPERGRALGVVGRQLGGELVAALGLAGAAAGEAQLGEQQRQPVRRVPLVGDVAHAWQGLPGLDRDHVEVGPPGVALGAVDDRGIHPLGRGQDPGQVTGVELRLLAGVLDHRGAVLADRLQGAVARAARASSVVTSRLWSASRARIAGTWAASTGSQPASTSAADAGAKGPAKTETRRSTARSALVEQAVAPVEGRAQRAVPVVEPGPPVSRTSRSARPDSSPSRPREGSRAAASSMARAMPSRPRHSATTRSRSPSATVGSAGRRAAEEQLDGVGRTVRVGRQRESGHRERLLEGEQQPCPAGRQDREPGTGGEQPLDQDADAVEQVLAVVEHEQRGARGEPAAEDVLDRAALALAEPEGERDGDADHARVGDRDQVDEPDAVGVAGRRRRAATRSARRVLPTPPGPTAVTSRCSASAAASARGLGLAADERRQRRRERRSRRAGSATPPSAPTAARRRPRRARAGRPAAACAAARRRGSPPSAPR